MFYLVVDEAVVDEQLVAAAANAAATFVNIHGQIEIRLWNSVDYNESILFSSFRPKVGVIS